MSELPDSRQSLMDLFQRHVQAEIDGDFETTMATIMAALDPDLTADVQEAQAKDYWRLQLEPAGVQRGGFFCDKAVEGNHGFSERKQGRTVVAIARPGDHVIVPRLDRSFRSAVDGAAVIQSLAARSVRFHSLDLPVEADGMSGGGIAVVLRAVAELDRSFASERTLEVIADRRERGLPVSGRPPLGWKSIGVRARDTARSRGRSGRFSRLWENRSNRRRCHPLVARPTERGELVQVHDDRALFQAAPDELPAVDIHSL